MEQITYISISYSFIDITLISGYLLFHYKYRRFRLRVNCRRIYCKYIESTLSLLRWGNPKVPPYPLLPPYSLTLAMNNIILQSFQSKVGHHHTELNINATFSLPNNPTHLAIVSDTSKNIDIHVKCTHTMNQNDSHKPSYDIFQE